MSKSLLSLEGYPRQDLYFHNVFAGNKEDIVQRLDNGSPLFCLRGRATLNREKPLSCGSSLVFHIPENKLSDTLEPMYPSPFESDDANKFPSYHTFVQRVPPECTRDAEQWISDQQAIPCRSEFLNATVEDVRVLPSKYFLGEY